MDLTILSLATRVSLSPGSEWEERSLTCSNDLESPGQCIVPRASQGQGMVPAN